VNKIAVFFSLVFILSATPSRAQAQHPITYADLMKIQRISDPQISPDGRWIAYTVSVPNLKRNVMVSHIWLYPLATGKASELPAGKGSDSRARWSPNGRRFAFISTRSGTPEVWIETLGGTPRQLTHISTGALGVTWAAKSDTLLFTSSVYPECHDDACNRARIEAARNNVVKARVIHRLFFRHWDHWLDGKYIHLFSVSAEGGAPRDLTPSAVDSPTFFLDAPDGYSISPDGKLVCYDSNHSQPPSSVAWTTNNDLYLISAAPAPLRPAPGRLAPAAGSDEDSAPKTKDITSNNPGSDASPQFSPNGRYIAYTSQPTNGYESSLFRLRVYDTETGGIKDLTTGFDQWISAFAWAPDSDTIYFTAPKGVHQPLFKTSISHPGVQKVLEGYIEDFVLAPGGKSIIFTKSSITQPEEIYRASVAGGPVTQLTYMNGAVMSHLDMNPPETVWTPGALGARIESLLIKPPHFDPRKKYPGLLLIHGGPQMAWTDSWFYRWNAELFASRGYVVLMPNPHGSVGYGQPFVAEISGDWGGACYRDLMKATDYLARLPYVDSTRIGAAGASFGGYMIDWIETQTHRFKALVSHDGVYDLRSMYGETEELWFMEWEFQGVPWKNPELYEKWSPSYYIQNARTPILIVEGHDDFRVPEGQAIQFFTSLQRLGVPSEFIYNEQEGHLVLKPGDGGFWYAKVFKWLGGYLQPSHSSDE
jgi:dipeptidyl aminopeptidase/acylaminoacyl peptidase